eukprot:TRINITY_DN13285_c0_g1_i1.p1 TRINITY_DN13285_c0_g1~~TRINITY_DN13285_c0_g1_i1.p1  ORF type:complete len:365 (+),score=57.67 TRINITY_DN13285_c0_g1_i1:473-1567(+)
MCLFSFLTSSPGTGIPLSYFCYLKIVAYFFILFVYPLVSFVSATHLSFRTRDFSSLGNYFHEQLLAPQDWFSFWRLNCRLSSYHSLLMGPQLAPNYVLENKWKFLTKASEGGVPVSPWFQVPRLVVKDKNEEGGMGIKFFTNATTGGDWIIQESFQNSEIISRLLPEGAPLSTFRVVTVSTFGLPSVLTKEKFQRTGGISTLSCVFRAGRQEALTDHSSILFNVDTKTCTLGLGTTNDHWYRLGLLNGCCRFDWISSHDITYHPDGCEILVTGTNISKISKILIICEKAHLKLLPDVPLAGWDVAMTNKGIFMLEVNLSCNFFRGSFDQKLYFHILDDYMRELDIMKRRCDEKLSKARMVPRGT